MKSEHIGNSCEYIDEKIKDLNSQIEFLKKEKFELESMDIYRRTALEIHTNFCKRDHTEGCSWFYEIKDNIHDWSKSEHQRQLKNAKSLLNIGYHISDLIKLNELGFSISV